MPVINSVQALTLTMLAARAALDGHPDGGFARYVSALALDDKHALSERVRLEAQLHRQPDSAQLIRELDERATL